MHFLSFWYCRITENVWEKSRFSKNWSQTSFRVSRVSVVENYSLLLHFSSGFQLSWRLTSITSITSIVLLRQQITDRSWRVAGVWEGVFVLIHPRRPRGGQSSLEHPRRSRGSQPGRVKSRDECFQACFRPCLKTFVALFLPAWLTAPGSPRMENVRRAFAPGLTDCPWVSKDADRLAL